MKNKLLANIHWIFILLALNNLFMIYEENTEKIESTQTSIENLSNQASLSETKLKSINKFKQNLSKSKDRVKEVVAQIEKIQRQFPSNVNDTEVLGKLSELGDKLKFRDLNVSPLNEESSGFYFTKKYALSAQGTFLQNLIFFENLDKEERILNVKSVEIAERESDVRGKFKVLSFKTEIESYRYNSQYKESSGVEEIENKFKVP